MGCTSSVEAAASNNSNNPSSNNNNGPEHKEKRHEKSVTAKTEATTDGPVSSGAGATPQSPAAMQEREISGKLTIGDTHVVRYAVHSKRGRDPDDAKKPNQDAYGVHESFLGHKAPSQKGFFAAVYDGHGPHGQDCSHFVRRRLPDMIRQRIEKAEEEAFYDLTFDEAHDCLHKAHIACDEELRACPINDSYSGTTAVSVYVHDGHLTIGNVGDSRAVLGCAASAPGAKPRAVALTKDQTPKRPDEAQRCIAAGARILSFGEIDPNHQDGDSDSEIEDPPRVWSTKGMYPGTAFTRSIGDAVAETVGVVAEPELMTVKIPKGEILIILASDGIFDVMSNEDVVELCFQHRSDPAKACKAAVEKSHEEWLLNDDCTEEEASYDDMTIACIFISDDTFDETKCEAVTGKAEAPPHRERPKRVRQKTLQHLEEMKEE